MSSIARLVISVALAAACANAPREQQAAADASPPRAVSFVVQSAPGDGSPEYLEGVALIGGDAIEVLVTRARLAEDGPRARLDRFRVGVYEGDTARTWKSSRRSDAVPVSRIRALSAAAGRDTVRLRIANTGGLALGERWLGFELEGQVAPPGYPLSPGVRHLHGERGALAAK